MLTVSLFAYDLCLIISGRNMTNGKYISYATSYLINSDPSTFEYIGREIYDFYIFFASGISAYSFEGVLVFSLLVICTCAYMRRVPRLKQWFLSEKKGFFGVFYKGERFHVFLFSLLFNPRLSLTVTSTFMFDLGVDMSPANFC